MHASNVFYLYYSKFCIVTETLPQYTNKVTGLTHLFCKLNQLLLYLYDLNTFLSKFRIKIKWFMITALGGK